MKNLKYLHYILIVGGFVAAYMYDRSTIPVVHRIAPLLMIFSFGTAAIFWGLQDLRSGRALMIHYYASRAERPIAFWTVIIVFRFVMGAILLVAFAWRLLSGWAP